MSKNKGVAWQHIEWRSVRQVVLRLQERIYKARKNGNISRVHWLQNILIRNYEAKLYSVLEVTTYNKGQSPLGEIFVSTTDLQKIKVAKGLKIDGKAHPVTTILIKGTEAIRDQKHIVTSTTKKGEILTIRDRAKQALCKLALEPEWEAVFEPNSYSFRYGRNVHDAIEQICLSMRNNVAKYVYCANTVNSFEKLDHAAFLKKMATFSLMEKQVEAWLKAGLFERYSKVDRKESFQTMTISEGGVISPFLANIALHGLETHLKECTLSSVIDTGPNGKRRSISVIRCADQLVIIHRDLKVLEQLISFSEQWFQDLGLYISPENSTIRDGRQGFEFLGFQCIQIFKNQRYKIQITPSQNSRTKLQSQLREIVQKHKAVSSYVLINKLRPVIMGWANYYQYCECSDAFKQMSNLVFQKCRAWVFRRHSRKSRTEIRQKYFPPGRTYFFREKEYKNNWVLTGESQDSKKSNFLPSLSWVTSKKYVKVKRDRSPFDGDHVYWIDRFFKYFDNTTPQKTLLRRQGYKCQLCGGTFTCFDTLEIGHSMPKSRGGRSANSNLQIAHRECHVKKSKSEYK